MEPPDFENQNPRQQSFCSIPTEITKEDGKILKIYTYDDGYTQKKYIMDDSKTKATKKCKEIIRLIPGDDILNKKPCVLVKKIQEELNKYNMKLTDKTIRNHIKIQRDIIQAKYSL